MNLSITRSDYWCKYAPYTLMENILQKTLFSGKLNVFIVL